ncbi:hypothetical protein [Endozoicomonas euniceicola]|uniref:Uncharacterized protein n=1 Tax=Endozoicomonas euniceicola TaxID=1234143 RepID=A0ABY6GU52_9GAMM|nr:hypothetical protein [Endozoicomonas euniceicola]UYM16302.1 hypothetical protein NX720_26495 [Endozoicomonas euniceicola]
MERHECTTWHYYLTEQTFNNIDSDGKPISVTIGIDVEFLDISDLSVLLPVPKANHSNITINHCIMSEDGQSALVFLTDATYSPNEADENGYMAVCRKIPNYEGYICYLYHSTYLKRLG